MLGLCKAAASLLQRRDAPLGLLTRLNACSMSSEGEVVRSRLPCRRSSRSLPPTATATARRRTRALVRSASEGPTRTRSSVSAALAAPGGVRGEPDPAAPPAFRRTSLPWGTASMAAPAAPAPRVAAAAVAVAAAAGGRRRTRRARRAARRPPPAPAAEEGDDAVFEMVWAPRAAAVATTAAAPPPFATLLRPSSATISPKAPCAARRSARRCSIQRRSRCSAMAARAPRNSSSRRSSCQGRHRRAWARGHAGARAHHSRLAAGRRRRRRHGRQRGRAGGLRPLRTP